MDSFLAFEETEQSKIFPNAAVGYHKITVERPLRLKVDLSSAARESFRHACVQANEEPLADLIDHLSDRLGPGPHTDYNSFIAEIEKIAENEGIKFTSKRQKTLQTMLAERDEAAQPVIKKIHKTGKLKADPIHGRFAITLKGAQTFVEYEPDTDLRDTEQIPLLEEGGIEAFFEREVLLHVPDAWIDSSSTKIGYEISFTRYFYKPQPMRTLKEIRADIEALERETEGLLAQILIETDSI